MTVDTIIEGVTAYMAECPAIKDYRLNVDFLPERSVEFAIASIPAPPIIKQYVDGTSLRAFVFTLTSVNEYGSDHLYAIESVGVYENVSDWVEHNSRNGILPLLPEGKKPYKMEVVSSGYLYSVAGTKARYQMQLQVLYKQGV